MDNIDDLERIQKTAIKIIFQDLYKGYKKYTRTKYTIN